MSDAEFDKLASDLYKTLGVSQERINSAARSGSWKRRESDRHLRTSNMKVKQRLQQEVSPRPTHPNRISGELASPPLVSSPPCVDLGGHSFTSKSKPIGNCKACRRTIYEMEDACTALDCIYHASCFKCSECDCLLVGKTFYQVKARVLCQKDYEATLQNCHACDKPVAEQVLKAVGMIFHPQCFVCTVCNKCLASAPFTVDAGGRIFCLDDFNTRYAPKCGSCCKPITPAEGTVETTRIVAMDKSYHPECYKCEDCGVRLGKKNEGGEKCYPLDDHLLCRCCNAGRIRMLTKANSIDLNFCLRSQSTTST